MGGILYDDEGRDYTTKERACHRPDGGDPPAIEEERLDTIFQALADRQRRCLIGFLLDAPNAAHTTDDLLTHLETVSPQNRERLRAALRHKHLPLLTAIGAVEYNLQSDTIRYHGQSLLEDLLTRANEESELPYRAAHSTDVESDADDDSADG